MLAAVPSCSSSHRGPADAFVARVGTNLDLNGRQFRLSGANVEWLGLVGDVYGSEPPSIARSIAYFPTHFEVDDVLATVREMGGTAVRSFTLGATVGCPRCIEPSPGHFNERAFRSVDYAIKSARDHGLRLIIPLVDGDAFPTTNWYYGNVATYARWRNTESARFYTDPTIIKDYERHVDGVLNRVNSYTGVRYRDDPTIMGWETCNECGAGPHDTPNFPPASWTAEVATHIKNLDPKHLVIDGNIQAGTRDPAAWNVRAVDASDLHYYPRSGSRVFQSLAADVASVTGHGQAFIVGEYGWDAGDFHTTAALAQWLDALQQNPDVSGDAFWALRAHSNRQGWMPVPDDPPTHAVGGEWWAFYYGGNDTRDNTAADMRDRGQLLRAHAYAMAGIVPPPAHRTTPPPVITSVADATVRWRGSAGASAYTVERAAGHRWVVLCDGCATDETAGWTDPSPPDGRACYRVRAVNFDDFAGPASAATCAATGG